MKIIMKGEATAMMQMVMIEMVLVMPGLVMMIVTMRKMMMVASALVMTLMGFWKIAPNDRMELILRTS